MKRTRSSDPRGQRDAGFSHAYDLQRIVYRFREISQNRPCDLFRALEIKNVKVKSPSFRTLIAYFVSDISSEKKLI